MEGMIEAVVEFLEMLHLEAFVLPLTFTCIAANGEVYVGRNRGAWENLQVEFLYQASEMLVLPLYWTFVDAFGRAACFLLAPPNNQFLLWPFGAHSAQGH